MRKVKILFKPGGSEIIDRESHKTEFVIPCVIMVELHYTNGTSRIKNLNNLTTIELIAFRNGKQCIDENP